MKIVFSPTGPINETTTESAFLAIQTNDPDHPTLAVLIEARIIAPSPTVVWATDGDFGKMLIHGNTPRMRTLQVYNDGVGPLSLASLALSGDNDFYVTGATDGIQVAPGEHHNILLGSYPLAVVPKVVPSL